MSDRLSHYGVKGMKWGVRKDNHQLNRMVGDRGALRGETRAETKQNKAQYKQYKKSTTRAERRADRDAARQSKMEYIFSEAAKTPTQMIITRDATGYPLMMQGSEFIDRLSAGGAFDVVNTSLTNFKLEDLL